MARRRRDDGSVRTNDRVIAVAPIGRVAEGSTGTVRVVDGFTTWTRYWVQWDNGIWMGSVSDTQVVRADRYEAYRTAKQAEAEQAAVRAANAPAAASEPSQPPPGEGAEVAGEASRIPAHLLERSRAAKARKAAAG